MERRRKFTGEFKTLTKDGKRFVHSTSRRSLRNSWARLQEAHHVKPVHTLKPGDKTRLEDFALLCSNCHRMVHAKRLWLNLERLGKLLYSRIG
jgi:hypothetical protein